MNFEILGIVVFVLFVFILVQIAKMREQEKTMAAVPSEMPSIQNEITAINGDPFSERGLSDSSSKAVSSSIEV